MKYIFSRLLAVAPVSRSRRERATIDGEEMCVKRTIQVRIFRGERQYVAECLDFPIVTEAPTLDELTVNIREAIALHLDGENLAEEGFAEDPTVIATLELPAVA